MVIPERFLLDDALGEHEGIDVCVISWHQQERRIVFCVACEGFFEKNTRESFKQIDCNTLMWRKIRAKLLKKYRVPFDIFCDFLQGGLNGQH